MLYIRLESRSWPEMWYVAFTKPDESDAVRLDALPLTDEDFADIRQRFASRTAA